MRRVLLASSIFLATVLAHAADIKILAAPAAREAMTAVAPSFQRQSGHQLVFDYQDANLAETAAKDERIDAVIAPVADMGVLARAYKILPDSRRTLGRSAPSASAPQGQVLAIAALKGGDHEDPARAFCAYLTLPETIAALRRAGLASP